MILLAPPTALAHVQSLGSGWTGNQLSILVGSLLAAGVLLLYLVPALRRMPSNSRARQFPQHKTLEPIQVEEMLAGSPPLVVDLRGAEEFKGKLGHIRGAMHLPLPELRKRFEELQGSTGNRPIVLVDRTDELSHLAADILAQHDFPWVYVLKGGMRAWTASKLPVYR